ncbi:katanin p80 isoform X2 [Lycorma delicatula]|uniref:katanin p80 isoform X2 n=1 Tax=Lycorma delicatula TaxID=130591 RepID=UPI003F50D942
MTSPPKRSWKLQEFLAHEANVNCLALGHKSGRVLVTGGDDKKVNLWAVGKPNCIMSLSGHTTPVECVRFNPTEELVAAGSSAGAIKIWDLEAAKMVRTLTGHKAGLRSVDFHPYGDFITSGSLDTSIKLWDIRCKGCIFTYKGHRQTVNGLKFSPDGQWVASGGEEGLVKLWDLRAGRVLREFSDHTGPITGVEFHPHEFLLASASVDRTLNFWDLESFSLVSTTERDTTTIRCITFSPEGECLFGGGQDVLKVFAWEPARMLDNVLVGWSKVQDIAVAQSQLVGAAFHLLNVVLWVVDLKKVNLSSNNESTTVIQPATPQTPFSHGQSIRKSFSKQKPSPETKPALSVKTIEEAERSETDPEDEVLPVIPDVNDYRAVFQPKRSLNRSPPPSYPFAPPSDEDIPKVVNPVLEPKSISPERQLQSMSSMSSTENGDIQLSSSPQMRGPSPSTLMPPSRPQRRLNTNTNKELKDDPPSSPESDFPVKLSNIHHSPSEPMLSRVPISQHKNSTIIGRSSFQPFNMKSQMPSHTNNTPPLPKSNNSGLKISVEVDRPKSVANESLPPPRLCKEDKDDDIIPMTADKPTGLDLEDFLPKNYERSLCYQQNFPEMSESEVLSSIMRGHESMLTVLKNRERHLQIIYSLWQNKDLKTAVDSAISMNDTAVIVDLLTVITMRPGLWNLDLCVVLLPAIYNLLQSKFEMYMTVGCDALRLILRNFSSVIKSNILSSSPTVGVDISREERYNKCVKCYNSLVSIRAFLLKRQTVPGKLGHTFRELHITLQNLDSN